MVVPQGALPVTSDIFVSRFVNDTLEQTSVNLRSRNEALLHAFSGMRLNENIFSFLSQLPNDAQHVYII